jgi:hypothetical protein
MSTPKPLPLTLKFMRKDHWKGYRDETLRNRIGTPTNIISWPGRHQSCPFQSTCRLNCNQFTVFCEPSSSTTWQHTSSVRCMRQKAQKLPTSEKPIKLNPILNYAPNNWSSAKFSSSCLATKPCQYSYPPCHSRTIL